MLCARRALVLAGVSWILGGCTVGERLGAEPAGARGRDAADRRAARAPAVTTDEQRRLAAWEDAGRTALRAAVPVPSTFTERIRFPDDVPVAAAYRLHLRRGQTFSLRVDDEHGSGALEADLFEMLGPDVQRPVRAAGRRAAEITYTAVWTGPHVLRLRPAPARGGLYVIRVTGDPPLTFPVAADAAISSVFGDPRDGGLRDHRGVDIFAPRGTPVLAAGDGHVTAVQNTPVGGRVIWQEDPGRGVTYYYAHLEAQFVGGGQRVSAGDTIGTVGNSGNATGTRPHLHFGVYLPGTVAIDPAPMLAAAEPHDSGVAGSSGAGSNAGSIALGDWARVNGDRVRLRAAPSTGGTIIRELALATPVRVIGSIAGWHRVMLQDGSIGFMAAEYTVPLPAASGG